MMAILYKKTKPKSKYARQRLKNNLKRTQKKNGVPISSQCVVDYLRQHNFKKDYFHRLTGVSNDSCCYLFQSAKDIVYCNKSAVEKIIKGLYVDMVEEYQIDLEKLMPRLCLDCKLHKWNKEMQELLINKSKQIYERAK